MQLVNTANQTRINQARAPASEIRRTSPQMSSPRLRSSAKGSSCKSAGFTRHITSCLPIAHLRLIRTMLVSTLCAYLTNPTTSSYASNNPWVAISSVRKQWISMIRFLRKEEKEDVIELAFETTCRLAIEEGLIIARPAQSGLDQNDPGKMDCDLQVTLPDIRTCAVMDRIRSILALDRRHFCLHLCLLRRTVCFLLYRSVHERMGCGAGSTERRIRSLLPCMQICHASIH